MQSHYGNCKGCAQLLQGDCRAAHSPSKVMACSISKGTVGAACSSHKEAVHLHTVPLSRLHAGPLSGFWGMHTIPSRRMHAVPLRKLLRLYVPPLRGLCSSLLRGLQGLHTTPLSGLSTASLRG